MYRNWIFSRARAWNIIAFDMFSTLHGFCSVYANDDEFTQYLSTSMSLYHTFHVWCGAHIAMVKWLKLLWWRFPFHVAAELCKTLFFAPRRHKKDAFKSWQRLKSWRISCSVQFSTLRHWMLLSISCFSIDVKKLSNFIFFFVCFAMNELLGQVKRMPSVKLRLDKVSVLVSHVACCLRRMRCQFRRLCALLPHRREKKELETFAYAPHTYLPGSWSVFTAKKLNYNHIESAISEFTRKQQRLIAMQYRRLLASSSHFHALLSHIHETY